MLNSPQVPLSGLDPAEVWKPWTPGPDGPWSLKWAGHLLRRAAFAAPWPELQSALRDGPETTIDGLLAGGEGQAEFDQLMDELAPDGQGYYQVNNGFNDGGVQAWWLYRIVRTTKPLRERMTLFWHNHFATSITKVQQPALMKGQNVLLRKHALGKFRPFLLEISRDPAMLLWLDSNSNVRGRANENYARELMELFSLGVGHYTEADVREAARAFTGWQTDGKSFRFNRSQHDGGPKTILGQTGDWDGGDVVRIVLDQPAAAHFLVRKLYRQFISESEAPPDSLLEPLAERFRASDYDIADMVRTILRSRLFFSEYAFRQRIKSPVDYVVGTLRALEVQDLGFGAPGPAPTLPRMLDGLGQTLLAPPNVKGWAGGEAWLNTATLLARHNLAWKIAQGPLGPLGIPVNPSTLVRKYAGTGDPVHFLLDLLLQPGDDEVDSRARTDLARFLTDGNPKGAARDRRLRETLHAIMLIPEYQLA